MANNRRALAFGLAATVLINLALPAAAVAPSPEGEWVTEGGKARVRIAACPQDTQRLCGVIVWSYRPPNAEPGPLHDINSQDPSLRSRRIAGLPLLQDFVPTGPDSWSDETIYHPEGGEAYNSKIRLDGADRLTLSVCILFFCGGQPWTRYAAADQ